LENVVAALVAFLEMPLMAAKRATSFVMRWSPEGGWKA
ncbi:MAG: hypothetical protein JWN40_2467, partial [Phycisphaerales bacterium]|nr:hypothetical protein [Phycisphaerales bacterium]